MVWEVNMEIEETRLKWWDENNELKDITDKITEIQDKKLVWKLWDR